MLIFLCFGCNILLKQVLLCRRILTGISPFGVTFLLLILLISIFTFSTLKYLNEKAWIFKRTCYLALLTVALLTVGEKSLLKDALLTVAQS